MASSSSSSPPFKHDVFVSFRGQDSRFHIVSHLARALYNKKIRTSIDDEHPRGDRVSPALVRGIQESKISVIIVSQNYAGSKLCLDELVKFIQCRDKLGQIVIPVFYKIKPADIRYQTGSLGAGCHRLLNKFKNKGGIWRNALGIVATLYGFHLWNYSSDAALVDENVCSISGFESSNCVSEAALVDNIVGTVLKELGIGKYDIFLSFRGGDSDYDFTSLLFKALQTKKLNTFCEDKNNRGDKISIIRAMEGAKIIIIIFSKNYADCNWCLDELVKILECRDELNKIVIPVFYSVDPRNVRNQKGDFGTAFDGLLNKYSSKEAGWRSALKDAGAIVGFDSSTFRSGAILIDTIVDNVLGKLTDGCSFYSNYSYHDVFLSFRGETRYHFVSHLVKALRERNIQSFFDEELNRGDKISIGLNRANKRSKISVIIFSENYAGSKWCLDELVKILECMDERNQIVIPVFYKVDPANVQNQKGDFGTAFDILVNKHQSEEARWRSALKNAGSIPGIDSSSCGSGGILIDKIVFTVDDGLKLLRNRSL